MKRNSTALVGILVLLATGCQQAKTARYAGTAGSTTMLMSVPAYAASTQRYIAERHKLEVITPESALQKSWESVVAFCGTIQCEVVSSTITARIGDSTPSGGMSLRVAPQDLEKLLGYVEKLGKVGQHTTEREDKTTAVVDTEAKIKNLTSFRDSLRGMLGKSSATVKDLVEIQQQLTETQSELDGETARRKILANETEKVAVELSFRVERLNSGVGGFTQIWNALRESGSILGDSTASLITTVVAVIPWLILIVPGVWFLRRAWRRLKLRRKQGVPSPPPATT